YLDLASKLVSLGFRSAPLEGDPLCRFRKDDLTLDVMPIDGQVLGFTNRWFNYAFSTAVTISLSADVTIRVATPLALVATKMEAFLDRGGGDVVASHDLEDLFTLLAGDDDLVDQIAKGDLEVHRFLRINLGRICRDPLSGSALRGHFLPDPASQRRGDEVIRRLRELPED
ncbi:MAG TPA: hypothetical protein VGD74_04470, partial [Vulgatibacter sp.]